MNRLNINEFQQSKKLPLIVVLDNVRSLYNVGSIFRSCDAFRVESLYLCGITAIPPNTEIHKTALGAEESISWRYFNTTQEAIEELKRQNYLIYSVEQVKGSTKLNKFIPNLSEQHYAIILGNEVKGVQQNIVDLSDGCIEIPQFGTKHSLNVSVTAGIIICSFAMNNIDKYQ